MNQTNYGAAYVFERSGLGAPWNETQKLLASDPSAEHYFGASVAIRGNEILVGAPGPAGTNAADAVYFFERINENWGQVPQQSGGKQSGSGDFGRSVALAGNFAVVGAPYSDSVSVFQVTTTSGTTSVTSWDTLAASVPQSGERFGAAVAATPDRIVVGAPGWDQPADYAYDGDPAESDAGRAFVFDLIDENPNDTIFGNWEIVARLTADGGLPVAEAAREVSGSASRFGTAVALDSQYVVVGAPGHTAQDVPNTRTWIMRALRTSSTSCTMGRLVRTA